MPKKKMSETLSRKLKKIYRQEKISTFLVTFGVADAMLGGFSQRWTLLSLGVSIAVAGGVIGWLQIEKARKVASLSTPRRYLSPSRTNLQPLPTLKRKQDYR
ncbi:hypothetical protein GM3709_1872 [Geminocystis sp. NIES-3709]|nr:hypothetical protein GM3709_1872 [Geminocystis sp. NIES-3709]